MSGDNKKNVKMLLAMALSVCMGLIVTLVFFCIVDNEQKEYIRNKFVQLAEDRVQVISGTLSNDLEILKYTRGLYTAIEPVKFNEFDAFVSDFLKRHLEIVEVSWIPWVEDAERSQFEEALALEYGPDFKIYDKDRNGIAVRAASRKEYFPIRYIRPLKSHNLSLVGYDLATDPIHFVAIKRAWASGLFSTTDRLLFLERQREEYGYRVFLPVYRNGLAHDTLDERLNNLRGLLSMVLDIGMMVDFALAPLKPQGVDVYISEKNPVSGKEEYVYFRSSFFLREEDSVLRNISKPKGIQGLELTRLIEFGDTIWFVHCYATPEFIKAYSFWQSWFILGAGLFITALLTLYLYHNLREKEMTEALVKERSDQISATNQELGRYIKRLREVQEQLTGAYNELVRTQSQLLQSEKMATVGQLAAGVAHEINNPMGFIISNLTTLGQYINTINLVLKGYDELEAYLVREGNAESATAYSRLESLKKASDLGFIMSDTPNLIKESYEGALRVKKIIQDLRAFSHPQEGKLEEICIAEVVDTTLNIVWNELKYKADIVKEYLQAPTVRCYPQQVSQVLINLLINAVQAIETKGTITIRIYTRDDHAFVEVQDTGCGMSEEIQRHLFEPFFTTKEVGKGIGLGLSISYGIVKKHNGDITVKSQVGQGTTMTVRLPIEGPETPPQDSHQA